MMFKGCKLDVRYYNDDVNTTLTTDSVLMNMILKFNIVSKMELLVLVNADWYLILLIYVPTSTVKGRWVILFANVMTCYMHVWEWTRRSIGVP